MDSKKLHDWLQNVGIFAVVGSLVFVGLQMRQDRQLAEAQFFAEADDTLTIAALVEDSPEVWIAGLRGDELSSEEEAVFQNIFMAARFSYAAFYEGQLRLGALVPAWTSRKFAYQLYANPGLRRLWNERRTFDRAQSAAYGTEESPTRFEIDVEKNINDLDSNEAKLSDIAMYQVW